MGDILWRFWITTQDRHFPGPHVSSVQMTFNLFLLLPALQSYEYRMPLPQFFPV